MASREDLEDDIHEALKKRFPDASEKLTGEDLDAAEQHIAQVVTDAREALEDDDDGDEEGTAETK